MQIFIIAYIILCPIQEFITRGVLQGSLLKSLKGKYRISFSLILSNILFSIAHQHLGLIIAFLMFFPGLFWGWLFQRHQSLIGVSLSHIAIGLWVTVILSLQNLVM